MAILSSEIGEWICIALGLEPTKVKSIYISLVAGDVAMIDVTEYINKEDGEYITEILSHYKLVKKEV